uniref:zinc finger protein DZIP1L-like isoform X2 n=1 Tax=Halichoerus grypus TaxID=9711 RepID=UPI00165942C3|nr:zinc finger protein DZIP1L-like isoform X2 [Halichoerus grypus]
MNATFLRGHIQRRHAGAAVGKQKQQEQPVEEVLEELRAKLKWTQGELEAQREAERQRQLQEAEITRQKEIEAKKEFDEWKEKERAKLYEEIDKLKKLFWDEFKSVANHNSTLEEVPNTKGVQSSFAEELFILNIYFLVCASFISSAIGG